MKTKSKLTTAIIACLLLVFSIEAKPQCILKDTTGKSELVKSVILEEYNECMGVKKEKKFNLYTRKIGDSITMQLIPQFAYELHNYKIACYNDSMYCKGCVQHNVKIYDSGSQTYYYERKTSDWIHLTPTIEGFIEYIEKKYKIK
jgi:hypothetical protein